MNSKMQTRRYAFDFLRILAACAVIMIHVSGDYVTALNTNTQGFFAANLLNSLSRFAVPVFVMISGGLLLDENRAMSSNKVVKMIGNMLITLFSWSLFYAIGYDLIKPIVFHEELSVSAILDTFFNGHYHMWYLYLLIGLYIVTPALRFFIKKENARLIRNYLLLSVAVCFAVPFVNQLVNHFFEEKDAVLSFAENFELHYFYEYLVYYVLGWYITHVGIDKKHRVILYVGGVIGFAMTVIGSQIHFSPDRANYFYENNSLNVFAYGIAAFTFIYYWFEEKKLSLNRFWLNISKHTFGVYLIHCCYLFVFKKLASPLNGTLLEILAIYIPSVTLSFLTVAILARIPYARKLVRG